MGNSLGLLGGIPGNRLVQGIVGRKRGRGRAREGRDEGLIWCSKHKRPHGKALGQEKDGINGIHRSNLSNTRQESVRRLGQIFSLLTFF